SSVLDTSVLVTAVRTPQLSAVGALAAARDRLLSQRRPYIAVHAADPFVVVATAIVPEAVVVIESGLSVRLHRVGQLFQIVGVAATHASRNEPCHGDTESACFTWPDVAAPPVDFRAGADEQPTVAREPTVGNNQLLRSSRRKAALIRFRIVDCGLRNRSLLTSAATGSGVDDLF